MQQVASNFMPSGNVILDDSNDESPKPSKNTLGQYDNQSKELNNPSLKERLEMNQIQKVQEDYEEDYGGFEIGDEGIDELNSFDQGKNEESFNEYETSPNQNNDVEIGKDVNGGNDIDLNEMLEGYEKDKRNREDAERFEQLAIAENERKLKEEMDKRAAEEEERREVDAKKARLEIEKQRVMEEQRRKIEEAERQRLEKEAEQKRVA